MGYCNRIKPMNAYRKFPEPFLDSLAFFWTSWCSQSGVHFLPAQFNCFLSNLLFIGPEMNIVFPILVSITDVPQVSCSAAAIRHWTQLLSCIPYSPFLPFCRWVQVFRRLLEKTIGSANGTQVYDILQIALSTWSRHSWMRLAQTGNNGTGERRPIPSSKPSTGHGQIVFLTFLSTRRIDKAKLWICLSFFCGIKTGETLFLPVVC